VTSRLYERTAELAAIDAAVARLAEGRGSSLLLEARAGRGKSTLLEHAVDRARASGARVLGARARHLTSAAPYEVLRRLLGPAVEQAGGPDALEGAARFAIPLFTPGADLSHGVDYGCQWLIAWLAERDPLLLAVDDAHWADGASLQVLLDVQAEISAQRVAMVVASRPVENPETQRLLAALAAHPDCEVLMPGALSRQAVGELLTERLGQPVTDDVVQECLTMSRGNALYLTELLRWFEADVRPDRQALEQNGTLSLRRTVSWRLGELGPAATALAQAAAILGDGCSLRHAAQLAGLDEALAAAEAARLEVASVWAHGHPVEFLHPLLRAAVEAELPDVMTAELHARAARILWESDEDPAVVAQHLMAAPRSGDAAVSAYLYDQGRAALEAGSVAVARRLLRRALDEPAPPEQRDALLLWLGLAEHRALELEAAREHLEAAFASSDRAIAFEAAGNLFDVLYDAGLFDQMGDLHRRALRLRPFGTAEAEVALRAMLLANVIMSVDADLGDLPPELTSTPASSLTTLRDVDRYLLVLTAVYERGRPEGSTDQLMAELHRAVAALPDSPDDLSEWDVRSGLAAATFLADEGFAEVEAVLDRMAPATARLVGGRPQLQAELDHRRIQLEISRGAFEDALERLSSTEGFTIRHRVAGYEMWHRLARSRIALQQGRYADAASLLEERTGDDLVYPALGALLSGDAGRALAMLKELTLAVEPGAPLQPIEVELQPHLLASHVHEALGDRDQAAAEARRELEIRREYGPTPALAEALRRWAGFVPVREGIGLLAEATTLIESTPCRPVLARVLASYGVALTTVGRVPEAREALARAADLASDMGMERLLTRVQGTLRAAGSRPRRPRTSGPTSLTQAQRDVALLAVDGLTNREIAEHLFVTIKTVETHLMAVYRKLGIRSRDELAGALLAATT
jgi:DNA-binding CsgD family transcriptional regulator